MRPLGRRDFLRATAVSAGAAALGLHGSLARADTPPSATERRFDHIDGTPLYYWRLTDGTAGQHLERRTFASTTAFHDRLVRWVRDLRDLSFRFGGFTGMQHVVTAGLFVAKPGQHGLGQAIDVDQVAWANGAITPYRREHESGDPRVVRRYLALDAVCRRHFRYVLDGRYNAAHADHLHMDFAGGALVCDRTSRSDTVFVQQCCNLFQGSALPIDGKWGARTQAAFDETRRRLAVSGNPHVTPEVWRQWLFRTASCGFANRAYDNVPERLPDPLEGIVDPIGGPVEDGLRELLGLLG